MKFVIFFTYLMGIGLPTLETYRRGFEHWLVHSMTMAGDYLMGAILLAAGISFSYQKNYAVLLLVIAWGYVLGVMNAAFWGHLEGALRGITLCDNDPAELNAIAVKGVMWLIALICVVLCAKNLHQQHSRGKNTP